MTRSFKDTVKARAERDAAFRDALLTEGVDALLSGLIEFGLQEIPTGIGRELVGLRRRHGTQLADCWI